MTSQIKPTSLRCLHLTVQVSNLSRVHLELIAYSIAAVYQRHSHTNKHRCSPELQVQKGTLSLDANNDC